MLTSGYPPEYRVLRNKIAHAYLPNELRDIYESIVKFGSEIIKEVKGVEARLNEIP